MIDLIKRFLIFTKERFSPLSHLLMISLFVLAHITLTEIGLNLYICTFLFCLSFFFKLRLFDEVKDYETDKLVNPTRPLPRGLVTKREVLIAAIFTYIIEGIIYYSLSNDLTPLILLWIYTILMFKEFFIGKVISPLLTTYGMLHTLVMFILSFSLFEILSINLDSVNKFLFSFASWCCFNIFEIGRKTYSISEERENVPTYTSIWGIKGATFLCFTQVIGVFISYSFFSKVFFWEVLLIYLPATLYFLINKNEKSAKYYRLMTSLFIILYYVIISLEQYKGFGLDIS